MNIFGAPCFPGNCFPAEEKRHCIGKHWKWMDKANENIVIHANPKRFGSTCIQQYNGNGYWCYYKFIKAVVTFVFAEKAFLRFHFDYIAMMPWTQCGANEDCDFIFSSEKKLTQSRWVAAEGFQTLFSGSLILNFFPTILLWSHGKCAIPQKEPVSCSKMNKWLTAL